MKACDRSAALPSACCRCTAAASSRRPESVPARAAEALGERGELVVGAGERGGAQEQQRRERRAGEVRRLVERGRGLHRAAARGCVMLGDRPVDGHARAARCRSRRWVLSGWPGRLEPPVEHLLARGVARRRGAGTASRSAPASRRRSCVMCSDRVTSYRPQVGALDAAAELVHVGRGTRSGTRAGRPGRSPRCRRA